jgi:two-component system KDP operon response regulator KdpE
MANSQPVVLVIEDDAQMQRMLRTTLHAHQLHVIEAMTARDGLMQAAGRNPDVILLDLGLPDADGLDVVRTLRERTRTPIIVISARGQERDKIAALDLGADDYLTKPFGVPELLARIRVAIRHASTSLTTEDHGSYVVSNLRVDLTLRRVWRGDDEVHLTPTEYKLLSTLVRHAGRVLTHRQLLEIVWGANALDQTHYLRVYMAQLRHKIEADPARPRILTTEPGVGYRLQAAQE